MGNGICCDCRNATNRAQKAERCLPCAKRRAVLRADAWNKTHPEKKAASDKSWIKNNPGKIRDKYRRWRMKNPLKVHVARLAWRNRNRDLVNAANARSRRKNSATVNAINNLRRALNRSAAPPWLTPEHRMAMKNIYARAADLSRETGVRHEVDHIWPINGVGFVGLHVPWNLQVLTARENVMKSNRVPSFVGAS